MEVAMSGDSPLFSYPPFIPGKMFYDLLKRIIDFVGSFFALILFSPIYLLTALAIKMDSPGPVFYIHERVTKHGKAFRIVKFRTMYKEFCTGSRYQGMSDEEYIRTVLKDPKRLEEFKKFYKMKNDPRITKIGSFLRKTSIDELPQFWNVLIGDMSIVGPRAYRAEELNRQMGHYPKIKPLVREILTIKPGITGPWQVGGRSNISFDKRVRIDANYAKKRSLLYDFWIMLKTPLAVIQQEGAA